MRPARSVSSTPSSRSSALIAAETDGWVTTSSAAAAVTEPRRTTVINAFSWVRVIAIGFGPPIDRRLWAGGVKARGPPPARRPRSRKHAPDQVVEEEQLDEGQRVRAVRSVPTVSSPRRRMRRWSAKLIRSQRPPPAPRRARRQVARDAQELSCSRRSASGRPACRRSAATGRGEAACRAGRRPCRDARGAGRDPGERRRRCPPRRAAGGCRLGVALAPVELRECLAGRVAAAGAVALHLPPRRRSSGGARKTRTRGRCAAFRCGS